MLARWFRRLTPTTTTPAPATVRCEACPLAACDTGTCALVLGVSCGTEEACRLRTLGVFEGARVGIVDRRHGMVLDVCGTRLALDATLAAAIRVRPLAA